MSRSSRGWSATSACAGRRRSAAAVERPRRGVRGEISRSPGAHAGARTGVGQGAASARRSGTSCPAGTAPAPDAVRIAPVSPPIVAITGEPARMKSGRASAAGGLPATGDGGEPRRRRRADRRRARDTETRGRRTPSGRPGPAPARDRACARRPAAACSPGWDSR